MNKINSPYIVDIKRNSLDDGPGIRTVLFFKGCPLSCVWCQNPETKSPKQEIMFEGEKCTDCQECASSCYYNALNLKNEYPIDQEKCNLCGRCIEECKIGTLRFAGRKYTISELIDIILKDKVFFQNSGGGITFSGGEPTMHMEYLHQLLKQLNDHDIHVCLETCGYYNLKQFNTHIFPHLDLIYFDLKLYNNDKHNRYCKTSNIRIKKNFESLINETQMEVLPRIPLIPNITATKENLQKWATYLKDLQIRKVGLLPYNPLWISKAQILGKVVEYSHSEWLTNKKKESIKDIFQGFEYRDF